MGTMTAPAQIQAKGGRVRDGREEKQRKRARSLGTRELILKGRYQRTSSGVGLLTGMNGTGSEAFVLLLDRHVVAAL